MAADPLHTAHGLRALKLTGGALRYGTRIHAKWIRRRLRVMLRPRASVSVEEQLTNLRLLLDGLSTLKVRNQLPRRMVRLIAEQAAGWWRRSMQTERDARNIIQILDRLEARANDLVQHLGRKWLPDNERRLASMKPDSSLPIILDLVWIIRRMYPDSYLQRNSIRQVADNLVRVFGVH